MNDRFFCLIVRAARCMEVSPSPSACAVTKQALSSLFGGPCPDINVVLWCVISMAIVLALATFIVIILCCVPCLRLRVFPFRDRVQYHRHINDTSGHNSPTRASMDEANAIDEV